MNKVLLVVFLAYFLIGCSNKPELIKTIHLNEITNPHVIKSDHNSLVISNGVEGTEIFIYDKNSLKLKTKFGGTGEEKDKFVVSGGHSVGIDIRNDSILISSHWKASFFDKNGNLLNQIQIPHDSYNYIFYGNGFSGIGFEKVNNIGFYTFNRYDSKMNFIKEITRIEGRYQAGIGNRVYTREYQGVEHNNKFYFKGKTQDLEVEVYDKNSNLENKVKFNYQKLKTTEDHKESVYKGFREHPFFGKMFEQIKKTLIFPDFLPAIHKIYLADNHIHCITYSHDSNKAELIIFSLDGKFLERFFVPLKWKDMSELYPLTISDGIIYQLIKNNEQWMIQLIKI